MIKFFREICHKLFEQNKIGSYFKYTIGEIVLVSINKTALCPVRNQTWVSTNKDESNPRAFRYEIYNVPNGTLNQHIKYLLPR